MAPAGATDRVVPQKTWTYRLVLHSEQTQVFGTSIGAIHGCASRSRCSYYPQITDHSARFAMRHVSGLIFHTLLLCMFLTTYGTKVVPYLRCVVVHRFDRSARPGCHLADKLSESTVDTSSTTVDHLFKSWNSKATFLAFLPSAPSNPAHTP